MTNNDKQRKKMVCIAVVPHLETSPNPLHEIARLRGEGYQIVQIHGKLGETHIHYRQRREEE